MGRLSQVGRHIMKTLRYALSEDGYVLTSPKLTDGEID